MRLRVACSFAYAFLLAASGSAKDGAQGPPTAERILEAIKAREGSTVCEIGAGDGELSLAAARSVGPGGRVYASELGENRLKRLRDKVAGAKNPQVAVVTGEASRTNFGPGACDGLFLRDVYHHLSDPAAMNASIAASLKPGGHVAVIDFTPPGKEAAKPGERAGDGRHGVYPETVVREMKEAGLEVVSLEKGEQRWFMVVLARRR